MAEKGRERQAGRDAAAAFQEKLADLKAPLSTTLGALDLILLGGMGEVREEQKQFLQVAKRNLENLFVEIQKFTDWAGSGTSEKSR